MKTIGVFILVSLAYYAGAVSNEFFHRISEEIADEIRLL